MAGEIRRDGFGTDFLARGELRHRVIIQADLTSPNRRAALWGMDRAATAAAVDTFIARGWLDEFLDQCWRFRAGSLA